MIEALLGYRGQGGPGVKINDALQGPARQFVVAPVFDVETSKQIEPMRLEFAGLVWLLDQLLQLLRGQIQALIMLDIDESQLFADFAVQRILFEMFDIRRGLRGGIV